MADVILVVSVGVFKIHGQLNKTKAVTTQHPST